MQTTRLIARTVALVALAIYAWPLYAYEVAAVSGGGSIEGKVVYHGNVPTKKIIPTKDVEVCGGPREEPLIRVGADQGVESAVVYLIEVAKGKAWRRAGKPPELDKNKCRFEPRGPGVPRRQDRRRQLRSGAAQHARLLRQAHRVQSGAAESRTRASRPTAAARARCASTATRTAGWKAGSTSSTTPTTRSPAPTANSASPTSRPATTSWSRCRPFTGPDRDAGHGQGRRDRPQRRPSN